VEWTFALPSDNAVRCRLTRSFWLGQMVLSVRGQPAARATEKGRPFLVRRANGTQAKVHVKGAPFDYVPKVTVDGQPLLLDRELSMAEHVAGGIPLALVAVGGAIGGLAGALGTMANYRILRADAPRPTKTIGILLVTGASYLVYSVVATMVKGWFGR
jgi:hypothetical protein